MKVYGKIHSIDFQERNNSKTFTDVHGSNFIQIYRVSWIAVPILSAYYYIYIRAICCYDLTESSRLRNSLRGFVKLCYLSNVSKLGRYHT